MDRLPTILIGEDEEHTRNRLANAVRSNPNLDLVATAENVADGRQFLQTLQPDVILTDLNLPDGSGIDLIKEASKSNTESMVITVFDDEAHVVDALCSGATGYLLKDCDAVDVSNALVQLLEGGSPISPSIARYLLKVFRADFKANHDATAERNEIINRDVDAPTLTKRENEVLSLIAKGYSYKEIAETLSLSVHTVTSHIKHIYRKLAVGSRGEAVYEANMIGLL